MLWACYFSASTYTWASNFGRILASQRGGEGVDLHASIYGNYFTHTMYRSHGSAHAHCQFCDFRQFSTEIAVYLGNGTR